MDETPELQLFQRVEIGGRTMLRPGFSLVGLTGVVFPTQPNAPAGCVTVAIDWPEHGYTPANGYPEGTLPAFVNVPVNHLTPKDEPGANPLFSLAALFNDAEGEEEAEETMIEPAAKPGPALQILGGGAPRLAAPAPQAKEEPAEEPEPEPEPPEPANNRPRLRMI